jgi:hypothetical protein
VLSKVMLLRLPNMNLSKWKNIILFSWCSENSVVSSCVRHGCNPLEKFPVER